MFFFKKEQNFSKFLSHLSCANYFENKKIRIQYSFLINVFYPFYISVVVTRHVSKRMASRILVATGSTWNNHQSSRIINHHHLQMHRFVIDYQVKPEKQIVRLSNFKTSKENAFSKQFREDVKRNSYRTQSAPATS